MGAVSYATRCTAKAKGSKLHYVIYVLSAVGYVMRVQVPATCCLVCCWGPCNWNTWSRQLQVMRWLDFRCWFGSRVVHIRLFLAHCSWKHCLLCLDSVLAAYWPRIEQEPNLPQMRSREVHSKTIFSFQLARDQIFSYQVTHRLEHSVPRWPGDSNVQSLGGPETRKFSLWVPPRDSNMQSSRDPEEGMIIAGRGWKS